MNATTSVLGTKYKVYLTDLNNPDISDCSGKCYVYKKEIAIRDPKYLVLQDVDDSEKQQIFQEVLLHELVHAYNKESGVHYDDDENLVDWIAQTIPKIIKSYDEVLKQLQEQEADE